MALPRLDPRVSKDRIYEYGEYKVLSAQFARRQQAGPVRNIGGWIGTDTKSALRPRLTYGVLVGLGVAVLIACAALAAFLESDSLRLSYAQQDLKTALAGIDQTLDEATTANQASEQRILASAKPEQGLGYPLATKYVVLTNIPAVSGGTLVSDLYPLSRKLIRIAP